MLKLFAQITGGYSLKHVPKPNTHTSTWCLQSDHCSVLLNTAPGNHLLLHMLEWEYLGCHIALAAFQAGAGPGGA